MIRMPFSAALLSILTVEAYAQINARDREITLERFVSCLLFVAFDHIVDEENPTDFQNDVQWICDNQIRRLNEMLPAFHPGQIVPEDEKFDGRILRTFAVKYRATLNKHKEMYHRRR